MHTSTRRYRFLAVFVAVMVLVIMIGGAITGAKVVGQFTAVEESWERYDATNAIKGFTLNQIRKRLGFGGLIHDLKNYILTGDRELASLIDWDFKTLRASIAQYEVIGESKAEIDALFKIRQVVNAYERKFQLIRKAVNEGQNPLIRDRVMEVDPRPALAGLSALEIIWLEARDEETNQLNRIIRRGRELIQQSFIFLPLLAVVLITLLWVLRHLLNEVVERTRAEKGLRRAHDDLEVRVEERTRKLTEERNQHRETSVELREKDVLLRGILANSPSELYVKDLDGQYLMANQQFLENHDLTLEEVIGKKTDDIFPLERATLYIAHDREVLDSKRAVRREVSVEINGVLCTQFVIKFPIRDDSGNTTALGCIGTDITVLKRAEVELRRAMEEAELASRTKSDFLANMSHELRTPLNAVIGFSESIKNEVFGPMENRRYAEYIDNILESGEHLLDLINDILDVSAIETGRLDLEEKEIDLANIADTAIRLMRSRAEKGRVKLVNNIDKNACGLIGDERRMKQILLNLLSNGVNFTPEGGRVVVETRQDSDGALILTITDNGVGMDDENLAKAMSPFTQGDSTIANVHGGTGLGLPVTKGLVEAHGGFLKLESVPEEGTTVVLRFPKERVVSR